MSVQYRQPTDTNTLGVDLSSAYCLSVSPSIDGKYLAGFPGGHFPEVLSLNAE